MKNIRIIALMICLYLFVAVNANAQAASPWYGGVKLGLVDVDGPGLDEPVNLGLMVGYDLPDVLPNFSVEGEFTTSVVDGDIPGGGDWSVDTLAVYGVFKPQFDKFYLKGKAGISFIDVDFPFGSEDEVELGLGFGAGMPINDVSSVELEYTFLELTDASYLSIGYVHRF